MGLGVEGLLPAFLSARGSGLQDFLTVGLRAGRGPRKELQNGTEHGNDYKNCFRLRFKGFRGTRRVRTSVDGLVLGMTGLDFCRLYV